MVKKLDKTYFTANANKATQTGSAQKTSSVQKLDRSYFDRQNTPTTDKTPVTTTAPSTAAADEATGRTLPAERGYKHKTNAANQQRREQRRVASDGRATRGERFKNLAAGAAKDYAASMVGAAEGLLSAPATVNYAASGIGKQNETAQKWIETYKAQLADAKTEEERKRLENLIALNEKRLRVNNERAETTNKNYNELTEKPREALQSTYQSLSESAQEDIEAGKAGLTGLGALAADVGVAGAQMLGDIALGAVTGGGALIPMAVRGYGASTQESKSAIDPNAGAAERMEGEARAQLYGTGSAALSVATEKISNVAAPFKKAFGGGVLDKAIDRALAKMNGNAAGKLALSVLSEGGEEMLEDVVQPVLQSVYNGKSVGENYSELELSDVLYDGLIGGILGGVGSGVEIAANKTANRGNRQTAQQTATQETALPATQTTQERAETVEGETALPTAENAPTARETDALEPLRALAEEVSRETVQQTPQDRLRAFEDVLGESGKRAMHTAYQDSMDVGDFSNEFLRAYHAGETGNANPKPTSEISYIAHEAGKNDAAASLAEAKRAAQFASVAGEESGLVYDDYVAREMGSGAAEEINSVAKALGVRVRMADEVGGGMANAEYRGSDILVEKNNPNPVMKLVGHEWTHRVQELAPEQYRAFRDAVTSEADVQKAAEQLLSFYRARGVDIDYEGALDEATANYAGELIADTDVLNDFIRKHSGDRTLLEKLRDALHELVRKLTGRAKQQAQTAEGMLQEAFEAASRQAEHLQGDGGSDTIGDTKYSLRGKYWRPDLNAAEWNALNRHMQQEITDEAHTLDDATKWAYANENGVQMFALYGIGDGTEATVLYAVRGHKATEAYNVVVSKMEGMQNGTYGERTDISRWIDSIRGNPEYGSGNSNAFGQTGAASRRTNDLYGGTSRGNSERVVGKDVGANKESVKYSLKEYSPEEKKQHINDAISYFGKTYRWDETGYLTPNGAKLDFSGRHEGGSGGYRTVDHRDIRDAIGDDYGGDDYSGSMVQFMSEGNIRISPESGGIDLSVAPTKAQETALSDFIGKNRGEVILDIDTTDGQTVASVEYPRGTHASKVLVDIRAYFEDGTMPQVSELAGFYTRENYSLKGAENAQELAALQRENEKLRERVEYWKGQTRRSSGVTTDKKSVQKAAKALVRDYGAEVEASELTGELQSLYDYIARGGDDESGELTYTEARQRAEAIAEQIAESAIAKDDTLYQDYADLRKKLKDTRLTLSQEDAANITDYAEVRKSMRGKLNMAKGEHSNIDRVFAELADAYPEFFSETRDMNSADQLQRMMDVASRLYTITEYNPFEGDMGQAVAAISNDIMDRFFDLPQTKKTFADKSAEKLNREKWKAQDAIARERARRTEQVANAKEAGKQAAKDAALAGQMAQGRADAKRLRMAQDALAREHARRTEQVEALRAKYREKDEALRESQKTRELRAKITRHASKLSQKLLYPTDKQHIPEELRSAVAAVLHSINQESRYTTDTDGKHVYDGSGKLTGRTVAFQGLRDQYRKILAEGEDIVVDPSLFGGENVEGGFDQVAKMGDKRLSELSTEELETMWKVLRAVEHSVTTAGKMLTRGKYETTKAFADAFQNDTASRRPKPSGGMSLSVENPYTFFAHYGQAGKDIYRMLRNAQDAQELMARDVTEKVRRLLGEKASPTGGKERVGALRGNDVWKYNEHTNSFTTAGGETLTLTDAQVMELYLLSKRDQARGHLLGGGIYQPEVRDAATGRVTTRRGTQAVKLTESDLDGLTKLLTPELKRVADGLQALTTDTLAKYGNEASVRAYGYRKFTEKDYWPIRSAQEGLHSTLAKDAGNARSIKDIGMAQQVHTNANNAVEVGSVFDTFAWHASDMIDYAAWLNPMEDANRLYNFRYRNGEGDTTGVTLKGLLDEKGGQGAQRYWMKLMGDIQNGIGTKDYEPLSDYFWRSIGRFKSAAVGANIRVVIQQPTAFFRAASTLNGSDMAKGLLGGVTRGDGWEKAVEHSPIAMRKDTGGFDISSPYRLSDRFYGKQGAASKLSDVSGAAAGKADAVTWGALWNACEWQVKRERPELKAGSDAFYDAVNSVFTDMIDQTQVVDGVLQRSNIMRGKEFAQQATSFMGEPTMSLNMMLRAYDNFRYEQEPSARNQARRKLARTMGALVVTSTVNALAQSIVDGLRDDDKDKSYLEKLLSAFTGIEGDEETRKEKLKNIATNGNLFDNLNPISQIPFAKDIQSLIHGYDVARPDMETFSGLISAAKTYIDSADGEGKKTRKEALLDLIAQGARSLGIPATNLKRDILSMLRTAVQESGSIPLQYELDKFSYNINSEQNRSRYISLLYDALEQGDFASYEHIRDDLINSMGLNGETINSSLKTLYKKKLEKDEGYSLSQKALDKLGIRREYAEKEESDSFGADDLDAAAYTRYENDRADTYRQLEDSIMGGNLFSSFSGEAKDKALNYAEQYAEKTALRDASNGEYEITTKWIQTADELEKDYKIPVSVYIGLKTSVSDIDSLKDKDGETINLSKGLQTMELIYQQKGLSDKQRTALFEAFNVPKSILHYNKALVAEKLKAMRKKAK